jgi:hypothetical protein
MEKIFFTVGFLVSFYSMRMAQNIPPFFTKIDIDSGPDTGTQLVLENDSTFWILGQGSKRNIKGWYSTHFSLHKVNQKGEVLLEKYYGAPYETWALGGTGNGGCIQTFDGNFLAVGTWVKYDTITMQKTYSAKLLKFNSQGDSMWTKAYNWGENVFATSIVQSADSGFVICGYKYASGEILPDLIVFKTDANGNQIWYYSEGYQNRADAAVSLIPSPHGYLVGGGGYNRQTASNDGWILLLSFEGKKIHEWFYAKRFGESDCSAYLFPSYYSSDFYMIHCHPDTSINGSEEDIVYSLARVNIAGEIIWERWLAGRGFRAFWDFKELNDGSLLVGGYWQPQVPGFAFTKQGWLSRYSKDGEPQWESIFHPFDTSDFNINSFVQASDGGFFGVGGINSLQINPSDIAFFKTDSFGCIQPGCQIFAGVEEEIAEKTIRIYPNPASDRLYIEADKPMQNMQLQIVDVNGRRVLWEEESVFSGLKEFDVSTWKSGMYWVLWTVDGQLKRSQSIVITN